MQQQQLVHQQLMAQKQAMFQQRQLQQHEANSKMLRVNHSLVAHSIAKESTPATMFEADAN